MIVNKQTKKEIMQKTYSWKQVSDVLIKKKLNTPMIISIWTELEKHK